MPCINTHLYISLLENCWVTSATADIASLAFSMKYDAPIFFSLFLLWQHEKKITNKRGLCFPNKPPKPCASKLPESRGERILFHGQPNLPPIFREISCGHFSWKMKDENRRNVSPNFRHIFRPCSLSGPFGITKPWERREQRFTERNSLRRKQEGIPKE